MPLHDYEIIVDSQSVSERVCALRTYVRTKVTQRERERKSDDEEKKKVKR